MLEVEMKFPVGELPRLQERLQSVGAHLHATRTEADQYFNAPDRDFAQTDEALRIRSIGEHNVLTYKGPKRDRETKTRTELEVAFATGSETAAQLATLLQHLGYRPVAVVRKERALYHLHQAGFAVEVCLDHVDAVGMFAEIEIVAPESQEQAAKQAVRELAQQLGFSGSERRSYLELWLEKQKIDANQR